MKKFNLNRTTRTNIFSYVLVLIAFIIVAIFNKSFSASFRGMIVPITCYIIMTLSLNLTVGILGELSLGHGGFMSIGAFLGTTAAIIAKQNGASNVVMLIVAIVVGTLLAGLFGFLIGIPVLRLRGDYLAIVTLAFGEIIKNIFNNVFLGVDSEGLHFSFIQDTVEVGDDGRMLIQGAMGIKNIPKCSTYVVGFILIFITLFVIFNFINSRIGRCIMAIRDNRIAAESVGIEVTKYKMIAFVLSAAIAGAAGAVYGLNYSSVIPARFDFNLSILVLVYVVFGGQGNMLGSIIAATVLTILPEALREFADYRMLTYAIVLIIFMIVSHNDRVNGLIGNLKETISNKFTKKGGASNESK